MTSRRGIALVLATAVLAILGVLATGFATLAQTERRAATQRLMISRAELLARSGVEDAMARVCAGQDPSHAQSRYLGEDHNGSGTLDGPEAGSEVTGAGILNIEDCPLAESQRPSFFVRDPASTAGLPYCRMIQGRARGDSGLIGQAGYALRVDDESAKLNVNGGFLDALDRDADAVPDHADSDVRPPLAPPGDPGRGWNFQLRRILDRLGTQPEVGVPNLGTLILQHRPRGGYRSIEALQAQIGTSKALSPWLTVSSWIDPSVVHPNGFEAQPMPATLAEVKRGRSPLRLEEGGRPPVHLNAVPRPVLVALIQGLRGRSWHGQDVSPVEILPAAAKGAATALLAARPFRDWETFSQACDALVPSVLHGMNQGAMGGGNLRAADLLKANFNPNTQLSKELPDQLLWKWIDKSDLIAWSTEGCLEPTGTFHIQAVGRILGPGGVLLAERIKSADVEAFTLARHTSQRDFVAGRFLPTDYLSRSDPSPPTPIPVQRTCGAGASWNPSGQGHGLGVMTYPCAPSALPAAAADFDGCLALATVETDPASPGLCFLHHFDDGWDADVGHPVARQAAPPGMDTDLQTDPATSTWPASNVEPASLYPDGMHAQTGRLPAFQALGNIPGVTGNHAVIGYWLKPMGIAQQIDLHWIRTPPLGYTQALCIGRQGSQWGLLMENSDDGSDTGIERQFHIFYQAPNHPVPQPSVRWMWVSAFLDTDETTLGHDLNLKLRGIRGPGVADPIAGYGWGYAVQPPEDIAQPGVTFVLGGDRDLGIENQLSGANQVVDEFEICDFGDDPVNAMARFAAWGTDRYKDGRYYKGGDGRFLSPLMDPGQGTPVRLLRASWTAYLPGRSRLEILNGPALPPAGQPRLVDPILADDPATGPRAWIEMDLLPPSGTLTGPALQPLAGLAPLQRTLTGFRYRVRWRTALADPLDQPLLETPVLDDVTFAWQAATGPRALRWE